MSEPSKAALKRAGDLILRDHGPTAAWSCGAVLTLAKHIQTVSDVAKSCMDIPYTGPERKAALQSLILPDEPKTFTVKMLMTREEQLRAIGRALDEGKMIKIVEASDD